MTRRLGAVGGYGALLVFLLVIVVVDVGERPLVLAVGRVVSCAGATEVLLVLRKEVDPLLLRFDGGKGTALEDLGLDVLPLGRFGDVVFTEQGEEAVDLFLALLVAVFGNVLLLPDGLLNQIFVDDPLVHLGQCPRATVAVDHIQKGLEGRLRSHRKADRLEQLFDHLLVLLDVLFELHGWWLEHCKNK